MKGTFKTLRTFKKLPDISLYTMDYTADYQLERLISMGAGSDGEFAGNVCKILLNGLPVKVKPEGACRGMNHSLRVTSIIEAEWQCFLGRLPGADTDRYRFLIWDT